MPRLKQISRSSSCDSAFPGQVTVISWAVVRFCTRTSSTVSSFSCRPQVLRRAWWVTDLAASTLAPFSVKPSVTCFAWSLVARPTFTTEKVLSWAVNRVTASMFRPTITPGSAAWTEEEVMVMVIATITAKKAKNEGAFFFWPIFQLFN